MTAELTIGEYLGSLKLREKLCFFETNIILLKAIISL
jgi:hypothetical protein